MSSCGDRPIAREFQMLGEKKNSRVYRWQPLRLVSIQCDLKVFSANEQRDTVRIPSFASQRNDRYNQIQWGDYGPGFPSVLVRGIASNEIYPLRVGTKYVWQAGAHAILYPAHLSIREIYFQRFSTLKLQTL